MCNVRRSALFLFLVFASGLITLADADACHRRGRRTQDCCEPTLVSSGLDQHHMAFAFANPTITGFLFNISDGKPFTGGNVTITVRNTAGAIIGQPTQSITSPTQIYTVNCTSPTLDDGLMTITYQRGTVMGPVGNPSPLLTVGGNGNVIHKINMAF